MKYLNFDGLSHFLSKLRGVFSVVGHTHTKSEITDYVVDSAMSSTSTNPVQNKVINTALSDKVSMSRKVNGKALTEDITLSASDVGADASGTATTKANEALASAKAYADEKVADLVDSAPDTLNTLSELATAIQEHQDVTDVLDTAITKKVDKVEGKGLSTNDYSDVEKNKLANIEDGAEVNQNAFGLITVNGTEIVAATQDDTLILESGANIAFTPDITNKKIAVGFSGTLPIESGGTGASNASDACKNIGALYLDKNDGTITETPTPVNADTFKGLTYDAVKSDIVDAAVDASPVQSVNGKTGDVTLTASDVGAAASDHTHNYPVTSVNGATGAVSLSQTTLANNAAWDLNGTVAATNQAFMRYVPVGASNIPSAYVDNSGAVIQMGDGSAYSGQIFFGFNSSAFIRHRRTSDTNWSDWYQFYTTLNKPTCSDIGASPANHSHTTVKDSGDGRDLTFNYSKSGMVSASWFAAWNGNELQAISPANVLTSIGAAPINHKHDPFVHSTTGSDGTAGYARVARFTIKNQYQNAAFELVLSQRRRKSVCRVNIVFDSALDAGLSYFTVDTTDYSCYMHKADTSIWDLYVLKAEAWDSIGVVDFKFPHYLSSTSVDWKNDQVTTLPTGYIAATLSKPTYTYSEVGAAAANHSHASIVNGVGSVSPYTSTYLGIEAISSDTSGTVLAKNMLLYTNGDTILARVTPTSGSTKYFTVYTNQNKPTYSDVGAAAASHTHSNYAAASHTHNYAGSSSAGGASTKLAATRSTINANTFNTDGQTLKVCEASSDSTNIPTSHWYFLNDYRGADDNYASQVAVGMTNDEIYYRHKSAGTWNSWLKLINSSHFSLSGTTLTINTA